MCPCESVPTEPPRSRTRRSRASTPPTEGQGWFRLHVPSISRAATPAMRIFGPSAHQIGPSPSHTAVGVQLNAEPAATTCRKIRNKVCLRHTSGARASSELVVIVSRVSPSLYYGTASFVVHLFGNLNAGRSKRRLVSQRLPLPCLLCPSISRRQRWVRFPPINHVGKMLTHGTGGSADRHHQRSDEEVVSSLHEARSRSD